MRILVDMQGAQTQSRYRGIGRYTIGFIKELVAIAHEHEIWMVFNAAFPDSITYIKNMFQDIIPEQRMRIFEAPMPCSENFPSNAGRARIGEKIREFYIHQLEPDIVVMSSLFEGFVDNAVTSISDSSLGKKTAVILYDLIPLVQSGLYLTTAAQKEYYDRKVQSLKQAGLLLAISEYSRKEAIECLGIEPDRVVNISAAVDSHFRQKVHSSNFISNIKSKYGIFRHTLMYAPGGFDSRKNISTLMHAFTMLPDALRRRHQLVIVGGIDDYSKNEILALAKKIKLNNDELVLTGYVTDDELICLYSITRLFIFLSKHEGFGLPVLEAMACGAPVIGSNCSSIPEVIGLEKALFDPHSIESVANKITEVLQGKSFLAELKVHCARQAANFTWKQTARAALSALENLHSSCKETDTITIPSNNSFKNDHIRLAFFSPLPPARTGIADYSIDILHELIKHFDVELITDQDEVVLPATLATLKKREIKYFIENNHNYDVIIYQVGNSPFHTHMFELNKYFPGIVVLHDFYLGNVLAYEECIQKNKNIWSDALYHSHGYHALYDRFSHNDDEHAKIKYPCNLHILQHAKGVIVHSEQSRKLADEWYGGNSANNWHVVPLIRKMAEKIDRAKARASLGFDDDEFLVCSFGFIDPTKHSLRLVTAWINSKLSSNSKCKLILVGENHGGDYGRELMKLIKVWSGRIIITGWVDDERYHHYLQAADACVQLRTGFRGETSCAVLDCMNYAVPTIVNSHGSMSDLPDGAVIKLEDEFEDKDLIVKMETLWSMDARDRRDAGLSGKNYLSENNNPAICISGYLDAIKDAYFREKPTIDELLTSIKNITKFTAEKCDLKKSAAAMSSIFKFPLTQRQLLVDVTSIIHSDLKTGIERVVRSQLLELLKHPPQGFRVEPVYLNKKHDVWHYSYACSYTCQLLGIHNDNLNDDPVDAGEGDVFYGLDFAPGEVVQAAKCGLYSRWHALGVQINALVYDLLPVLQPEFFPEGSAESHAAWLAQISEFADRLIGISDSVVSDLFLWLTSNPPQRKRPLKLASLPLGADIEASSPTTGLPDNAVDIVSKLSQNTSFLMVGTIEPRKGILQAISAFSTLWKQGYQVALVIVGREGWRHLPENQRRTIPQIVDTIKMHPEYGKRLIWLSDVSDEFLQIIYGGCACLIAASEGEGFGLPLIEAAKQGVPIIARDIPVFREVIKDDATYFKGLGDRELSDILIEWLSRNREKSVKQTSTLSWTKWSDTCKQLSEILNNRADLRIWAPEHLRKRAIDEHLTLIHQARIKMVSTLLPKGSRIVDLGGANCPLYKMGYPYKFDELTLIDLAPDKRHDYYKDVVVDEASDLGKVVIKYGDMTKLDSFENESVDFVWSGQSIEHVPYSDGERMCREAFRVLKKGGIFCLDTPNRKVTKLHTKSIGGGYIHPEHYIEYEAEQLKDMLENSGFIVKESYGVCDMVNTVDTGEFHYDDFLFGNVITKNVDRGYIQYHHCIKP